MTARHLRKTRADGPHRNVQKAPDDWVTGTDRMTAAQASYLRRLCEHAGEAFEARLNKAQASKRIHALQARTAFGRRAG
jgi:hypothetical protein